MLLKSSYMDHYNFNRNDFSNRAFALSCTTSQRRLLHWFVFAFRFILFNVLISLSVLLPALRARALCCQHFAIVRLHSIVQQTRFEVLCACVCNIRPTSNFYAQYLMSVPECWKCANFTLIKKGDLNDMRNCSR